MHPKTILSPVAPKVIITEDMGLRQELSSKRQKTNMNTARKAEAADTRDAFRQRPCLA